MIAYDSNKTNKKEEGGGMNKRQVKKYVKDRYNVTADLVDYIKVDGIGEGWDICERTSRATYEPLLFITKEKIYRFIADRWREIK